MAESLSLQKIAYAAECIAYDLLSQKAGDRVRPMIEYHQLIGVSSGTVKNAFDYLEKTGAASFSRHGHEGSYIKALDYRKLQGCCTKKEILGIMPLPYSRRYEGLASAFYDQLSDLSFNMAYARGAQSRVRLVDSRTCHFAITSRYAALELIQEGMNVKVSLDLGPESYLSSHVLVMRRGNDRIRKGMRVAYDENSLDQKSITLAVTASVPVEFVSLRTQQTVSALLEGRIDAGVWNYDAVMDHPALQELSVIQLPRQQYTDSFTSAVVVIHKDNWTLDRLLTSRITKEETMRMIDECIMERRVPVY